MLQLSLYHSARSRFNLAAAIAGVMLLNGCALIIDPLENNLPPIKHIEASEVAPIVITELAQVSVPKVKPTVAVYPDAF